MKFLNGLAMAGAGILLAIPTAALAADHVEAPAAAADPAADIADYFAWYSQADGTLVFIVTFAPLTGAVADGGAAVYDADVLYGIHVDNDGDQLADHDIWVKFGQNAAGDWGVQASGLPGSDPFDGPVDSMVTNDSGAQLWAGLSDDPFFFDLEGYGETLATGIIAFDPTRDTLAGFNTTTIALEVDATLLLGSDGTLQTWATTSRK